jgi:hypothetical protein
MSTAGCVLALACAAPAAADTFPGWTGTKGGMAWEAKRLSCGDVGDAPSRLRAHTRWRTSPANGYVRLTFVRQVRAVDSDVWRTAHRVRRSTRNTELEGGRTIVHWSQWFFPYEDEGGAASRHTVVFEWMRDRGGRPDRRLLRRTVTFGVCEIAP